MKTLNDKRSGSAAPSTAVAVLVLCVLLAPRFARAAAPGDAGNPPDASQPAGDFSQPIECLGVGWPAGFVPVDGRITVPTARLVNRNQLIFPETRLGPFDVSRFIAEDAANAGKIGRRRAGVSRPLPAEIPGEWHEAPDGGSIWIATIISDDSKMTRMHFADLDLPSGASLYYYASGNPDSAIGPIEGRGPLGDGAFWSDPVDGDAFSIELYLPPKAPLVLPFRVDEVMHHYLSFDDVPFGADDGLRATLDCMLDVHCAPQWPTWESISYSVARMSFIEDGGSYLCTGQLLATQNGDLTPYFLTANHCIGNQTVANTLVCRWFNQTTSCDGPLGSSVTSSSAQYLAGQPISGTSDWAFLLIRGVIPPGVFWSGWTTATINTGVPVHSISHPQGSWKRYAKGTKMSNHASYPGYQRVTFNLGLGTIDQGSSGSGIWTDGATPETQLLFGDCSFGFGPTNCDDPSNPVYYGRFQSYFPTISSYLSAGSDDNLDDNDVCLVAVDLNSGTYPNLVVKSLDEDWYRFSVGIVEPVTIDLTFTDAYGNIDAQLYDGCGGNVVASATSTTNNETIIYNNPGAPATYYLRVYLADDTRADYSLTISGASVDCNNNGIEDACDTDCGLPGCNVPGCGQSDDCNGNNNPDDCDIANNISEDCNDTLIPDECETAAGSAPDCNDNNVPDDCDVAEGGLADCNANSIPDECDIAQGTAEDCNVNFIPDSCEIAAGFVEDCNSNGVPDPCDVGVNGGAEDCNNNFVPDECELGPNDCNANAIPDDCEEADLAPTINSPEDAAACPGTQAVFTVSAPGATGYQWYRNDFELLSDGPTISGATTDTLTVSDLVPADDQTTYRCEVGFGCLGAFSQSASLDVITTQLNLTLISPPVITGCADGGVVILQTEANDPAGAFYQWDRDGIDLADDGHYSGVTTDTLLINNAAGGDSGIYSCRVWNTCVGESEAVSTSGLLEFVDPVFPVNPRDVCAEESTNAQFHAEAFSPESFILRWYEGTTQLADGAKFAGTTTDTLTVKNVVPGDDGRQFRLRALVISPFCSAYSPAATLTVAPVGGCPACQFDPGDMDGDGDFDLVDVQQFTICFGVNAEVSAECACANVDEGDGFVNLADWAALELLIAGPE